MKNIRSVHILDLDNQSVSEINLSVFNFATRELHSDFNLTTSPTSTTTHAAMGMNGTSSAHQDSSDYIAWRPPRPEADEQ